MTIHLRSSAACPYSGPTGQWCPNLNDNLGTYETPQGFFDFLTKIWTYKVDKKNFGPSTFTPNALLIDPFATICGGAWGALYFETLFTVFPNLSGAHYYFAVNETQFYVQWAFVTTGGRSEIIVPVCDIFCLSNGLVNYRLSLFDLLALVHALISAYGGVDAQLDGQLQERMWRWHIDQDFAKQEIAAAKVRNAAAKS